MRDWGYDEHGQAAPPAGNDFVAIAAGAYHSLALKSDGSIAGWGSNYDWKGSFAGQATPPEGTNFVAIATGRSHSLALKSDGSIVGWGANIYGQATPPEGNDFIAIAAGMVQGLALKKFVCRYSLVGDINTDCRVDLYDLALVAENWSIDCYVNPSNPACVPK